MPNKPGTASSNLPKLPTNERYQDWRLLKDAIVRHAVVIGGLGVIVAIVLIFFYLLYVVVPLFASAKITDIAQYSVPEPSAGATLLLEGEEQNEAGVRFTDSGKLVFFEMAGGKPLSVQSLKLPNGTAVSSFGQGSPVSQGYSVYGLTNGQAVVLKVNFKQSYVDNKRTITPSVDYPLGELPITIAPDGSPVEQVAITADNETTVVAAKTGGKIRLIAISREQSLFSEETALQRTETVLDLPAEKIDRLLLDKEGRNLYLIANDGLLRLYDISEKASPVLQHQINLLEPGQKITAAAFLNGDLSLLVGDSSGRVSQWTTVRNENNRPELKKLRSFKVADRDIIAIEVEQRRKGFLAMDSQGLVDICHSTSERELVKQQISKAQPVAVMLSPRANRLLIETGDGKMQSWHVDNEHPEVSLKSLWQKVWYESYSKPEYTWQSSSANNDFEPKYSLVPLVFGTLKAAFYAMLFAMPLALMGAIYTAYFMAPPMRQLVKPAIELMGALPTVIVGFLAGLWLAPAVEKNLAAIFLTLLSLPLTVFTFSYCWQFLPEKYQQRFREGWDAAILVPVIVLMSVLTFLLGPPLESWLFDGSLRDWLGKEFGIGYDQRNALIVGIAMGFAVIPSIFSIAEDAIFSVPKHLTVGSLALGATPWQTLTRVVLLTASPGIFSAVMIGLGRAIGETMIVLMATGNTPVMDFSIFQGLRTLAANVAVEMPESEVDGTHYRVLFLAALVLFVFTFVFNTLAEVIRQRLREKYSSL
jgi:phosphate transport system permease protein